MNGPTDPHGLGQEVPPISIIGNCVIGFVEEIHGEAGRPCPEYIPTRFELLLLARHWSRVLVDLERWWAASDSVGSDETRQWFYANERLNQITDLAGVDSVSKLFAEVELEGESDVPD
jgi:hypothetical protein